MLIWQMSLLSSQSYGKCLCISLDTASSNDQTRIIVPLHALNQSREFTVKSHLTSPGLQNPDCSVALKS